ncbi:type VII secretion protein [Ureibacillus massiliensis 4400831 = CIP 108448 = CCUG 49529]|uniref:Type VII secretion protein n=1 Tax=Ureibacillus massiliensis 4400831 = CIP 108448 = CCUG 49529 TaxID=1211035 RepID=A0A0A3J6T5_9BACL|nr:type VII secretion protein EssA [Ureibacillus massiliensis]KGR90858.1 type VII secretion protein [Ureibacillus massiliensis 4400831 = CIP 108448 = CCUG 49529]
MKDKVGLVFGLALSLWLMVGSGNGSGYAMTNDINSLNPNEYKENDFKDNKEFLHNNSLLENKKGIPDEQKQLDFIPKDVDLNEKMKAELFVKNFQDRKTVAYESMKLGLFSDDIETAKVAVSQSISKNDGGNKGLQYIYIGLLFVCIIIVLIWLVPKMVQGEKV